MVVLPAPAAGQFLMTLDTQRIPGRCRGEQGRSP
jgi:hypothetical protein